MNKRYLVIGAAVAMLVLIAGAVVVDCVRLADGARRRVELADEELAKHERRLVKLLGESAQASPEVQRAIAVYEAPGRASTRHEAYEKLVAAFRQTMQVDVDPTDPLGRKFMDDVAGAINRRELAEAPHEAELAAYREYLDSARGAVARRFSSRARDDWDGK